MKCQFLHAAFSDDWGKCPNPEQVREYLITSESGDVRNGFYCDEGAAEVMESNSTVIPFLPTLIKDI